MYDYSGYDTTSAAAGAGIGIGMLIFYLAIIVLAIVGMWKLFTKAGKPGWASIIPFYNYYVLFEIAGMSGWMFLLMLVPIANIVVTILLAINLAKAFGKGTGFAIGLIFLSLIFYLILAFGDAQYQGAQPQQAQPQQ